MKKAFFFLFLISAATAQGQTLKELLYGGKLKKDSTGVVRKTDDLSAKIDTTTKKAEPEKPKVAKETAPKTEEIKPAPAAAPVKPNTTAAPAVATENNTTTPAPVTATPATPAAPARSNNKIWKDYTDSLALNLKNDVLSSRKVKKESYFFSVEYEIGTDGSTNILGITISPDNDFLLGNVKQRINDAPPQLSPVLNSAGQPQKAKRRYNFNITKD